MMKFKNDEDSAAESYRVILVTDCFFLTKYLKTSSPCTPLGKQKLVLSVKAGTLTSLWRYANAYFIGAMVGRFSPTQRRRNRTGKCGKMRKAAFPMENGRSRARGRWI